MDTQRRSILKTALVPLLLPFFGGTALASNPPLSEVSDIRIIQTKDPARVLERVGTSGFAHSLAQATLAFVIENYPKGNLPVWKKPLSEIDLHSRIPQICSHVVEGVLRHAAIYPVDPCWIMGQMMAESFFYEFAVSSALAVGPCQFIAPTARGYGLVCADEHGQPAGFAAREDLEPEFSQAATFREQMRALRREQPDLFGNPGKLLRTVLNAQAAGKPLSAAGTYALALDRMDLLQARYTAARDNCRLYMSENFKDRTIFSPQDVAFLEKFDQRVLYSYSINAMVKMMAENLRARGGNILAATAGYNAGLGNTDSKYGVYTAYGRIPNFGETVDYVGKILVNHHEIARRIV
jgi:hypothetical protein